jgi:hypothetical protein
MSASRVICLFQDHLSTLDIPAIAVLVKISYLYLVDSDFWDVMLCHRFCGTQYSTFNFRG